MMAGAGSGVHIELDPLSEVPIYQQIRDRVVEAIAAGTLAPGEQLASVRRLAVAFGINMATVGKAYDALRHEGLIRTTAKTGSVVARGPADAMAGRAFVDGWAARLGTLLAEAYAQGVPRGRILAIAGERLDGFEAAGLAAGPEPAGPASATPASEPRTDERTDA